jgi:hypothetical protein
VGNITKVSFGITKNLGNYESLRLDMQAAVRIGESYQDVLNDLRTQVSISADFHQLEYVDLLQKSRQLKSELSSLVSERDRVSEEFKKLESIWSLIGSEIQSKFPSEISNLLCSYFDISASSAADALGIVKADGGEGYNEDWDDDEDEDDDEDLRYDSQNLTGAFV